MAARKKTATKGSTATKKATKSAAKKTTATKTTRKVTAKKPAAKKTVAKKPAAKKAVAKKPVAKKPVAKKVVVKKTVAKKPAVKKAVVKKKVVKSTTVAKTTRTAAEIKFPASAIAGKQTKSQLYSDIADLTNLSKTDVKNVFAALRNIVSRHVKTKGSGECTIPELGIKVRRVQKKASKARPGRNPFTGEDITIPAKPARKSVKATALKALKELV